MVIIDPYSVAAIPIQMFFNATELSTATAFVWQSSSRYWLITNWHNVSGKDPGTGEHLSPTGAEPNKIRVGFNMKGRLGNKVGKEISLRNTENFPIWLCHPVHRQRVDIVAIGIPPYEDVEFYAVNTLEQKDLLLNVGTDIFILGFPFGIGPNALPIWKRGSFATEPNLPGNILVDTASRPGMSGSPVIRRSWNSHTLGSGTHLIDGEPATKFVGVYSGRLAVADPNDAQLGIVWPASLVDEIVQGNSIDPGD